MNINDKDSFLEQNGESLVAFPTYECITQSDWNDICFQDWVSDKTTTSVSDMFLSLCERYYNLHFAVGLWGAEAFIIPTGQKTEYASKIVRDFMAGRVFNYADDCNEQMTDFTWRRIRSFVNWREVLLETIDDDSFIIITGLDNGYTDDDPHNWMGIYSYDDLADFNSDINWQRIDMDNVLILTHSDMDTMISEVSQDLLTEREERIATMRNDVFTELYSRC